MDLCNSQSLSYYEHLTTILQIHYKLNRQQSNAVTQSSYKYAEREKDRQTDRESHTERQRHRETKTETDRERGGGG